MGKKDLEFKKLYKREAEWLGCDIIDCEYWAHAECAESWLQKEGSCSNMHLQQATLQILQEESVDAHKLPLLQNPVLKFFCKSPKDQQYSLHT